MGVILYIVAKIGYLILSPITMLYAVVKLLFKGGLFEYFHKLAFAIDQYVILSCQCNVGTDTMRANFLSVNQF